MSKKVVLGSLLSVGTIAWVVASFGLSLILVTLPVGFMDIAVYEWLMSSPLGALLMSALVYMLAVVFIVLPLMIRKTTRLELLSLLGLRGGVKPRFFGWAVLLWAGYFATTIAVNLTLYTMDIPGLDLQERQEIGFENLSSGLEYVAAFLALVVIAPVFEEIMFRGYLFGRLRPRHGFWISAIVTSLVFAAVHLQVNVAIDVFILSMFMCVARERFNSIYPTIAMHMIKNGIAYMILFGAPLIGINLV